MFLRPLPFKEAIGNLARKRVLPTSLSSRELAEIPVQFRRASVFSARTTYASHLNEIWTQGKKLVNGDMDIATGRLALKQSLQKIGYLPDPDQRGTIQDLGSDRRLNLILKTQEQMAQGYGSMAQSQDPEVLDAWPCQELIREENREVKRNWIARWKAAGGQVYAGNPPGGPLTDSMEGRCIAKKDDPIWERISAFGNPYPPFDYNSGIGVADVPRRVAEQLGVIQKGEKAQPILQEFDANLEATVKLDNPAFKAALIDASRDDFQWDGDVLRIRE